MNTHTPEQALAVALGKLEDAQYVSNIYRTRCTELAKRIAELENLIIGIAYTELQLETLCEETVEAMRDLNNEGNNEARDFLVANYKRIEEVA